MQRVVVLCGVVASMTVLTVSDAIASDAPAGPRLHEAEADIDGGRLRAGIDGLAGAGFATGGVSGTVMGMALRLGWQLNRRFAACLQGTAFLWESSETAIAFQATGKGAFGFKLTPLLSLTPSDTIELAAGPSLDVIRPQASTILVDAGSPREERTIYSTSAPGMHGRFAVLFHEVSKHSPRERVGLALSAQMHATFVERGVVTMLTLGLGSEWY
jgi:hypothetical protein